MHLQAVITPQHFDTEQQAQQYQALIEELRCPKCQNQNLASSNAGIAIDLKNKAYQMVMSGKSNEEIRTFMVERYGDFVTYKPPVRPSTYILWYFPPILLMVLLASWLMKSRYKSDKQFTNIDIDTSSFGYKTDDCNKKNFEVIDIDRQLTYGHYLSLAVVIFTVTGVLYINTSKRFSIINQITPQFFNQNSKNIVQIADDLLTKKINMPPDWVLKSSSATQELLIQMQLNVHRNADDSVRWMRLGQVLLVMNDTDSALIAMERANRIDPNDAKVATTFAQTSYLANGEVLTEKAKKALTNLLYTENATNQKAVMILIMNETRQGNYDAALNYVEQLKLSLIRTANQSNTEETSQQLHKALASLDSLKQSIENNKNSFNN